MLAQTGIRRKSSTHLSRVRISKRTLKQNIESRIRSNQYQAQMASSSSSNSEHHNDTNDKIFVSQNTLPSASGDYNSSRTAQFPLSKTAVRASGHLQDYLKAYWIITFSIDSCHSAQIAEIHRHISWYGGNHRICSLDRHPFAKSLIRQIETVRSFEEQQAAVEFEEKQAKVRNGSNLSTSPSSSPSRKLFTRSNLTDFGRLYLSPTTLPAVFVNQHYLGGLEDLQMLERQKKLKDILQFGFEWKTNNFLAPVAGIHNDKALFKGQYVGDPVKRPIAMLPQVSTRFNVDDPYEA